MIEIPEQATLEQIANVASETGEPLTAAQAGAILVAYKAIHEGDELGTIRKDPDTGALAMRVNSDGMHMWKVTVPDGSQYNDLQPTLPWPKVEI